MAGTGGTASGEAHRRTFHSGSGQISQMVAWQATTFSLVAWLIGVPPLSRPTPSLGWLAARTGQPSRQGPSSGQALGTMPMTDYHFVSTWRLQAPIERVWEEIFHTERWPASANPRLDCLLLVLLALVVGRWRRRT